MPGLLTQENGVDEDNSNKDEDDEDEEDKEDKVESTANTAPEELLLLVDATNGFNNLSRCSMLWTVRHRCSKISRFTFSCYRHVIIFICRQPGGKVKITLSKEGVTQGDPLAMALYGIALLPLAAILREQFPEVLQSRYTDNAAMQGTPAKMAVCFNLFIKMVPMFAYLPEPEKLFAICPLASEANVLAAFIVENLEVKDCRGHRYVGG